MCRPLWAGLVSANEVFTSLGEGSHHMLEGPWGAPLHPFEVRWPREREVKWQPNTSVFYGIHDLPDRSMFDLVQNRFEQEMGTVDGVIQWVRAAFDLFGRRERLSRGTMRPSSGYYPTLLSAAVNTLHRDRVLKYEEVVQQLSLRKRSRESCCEISRTVLSWWTQDFATRAHRNEVWTSLS